MKIISVENVERKDVPIYYRLVYSGTAKIELNGKTADYGIDFSIEIKPTGVAEVSVSITDEIHYPLLPVIKELKKTISAMYSDGQLPNT